MYGFLKGQKSGQVGSELDSRSKCRGFEYCLVQSIRITNPGSLCYCYHIFPGKTSRIVSED